MATQESRQVTPFSPNEPRPGAARMNEIAGPLNQLTQRFNERRRRDPEGFGAESCIIKISSAIDGVIGRYQCKIVRPPGDPLKSANLDEAQIGTVLNDFDCIGRNLAEVGAGDSDGAADPDTYHIGRISGEEQPGLLLVDFVNRVSAPGLFPVKVVKDGGSAGTNKSSTCTFTYTVKNLAGDVLDTTVPLSGWGNGWSKLKLKLAEATLGNAYYDSGVLILSFVDEYPDGEQDCS